MRLVPGDVEVADAEGEVDGIEIFERCGQERKMKREEDDRHGGRVSQLRNAEGLRPLLQLAFDILHCGSASTWAAAADLR